MIGRHWTVGDFVPGYEASAVGGFGAPKGTPVEIIQKLNVEIKTGLADPDVRSRRWETYRIRALRLTSASSSSPKLKNGPRLDRRVNADSKTKPRMPWVQQFSKLGSVGVLKLGCTTRSGPTPQSDTSHQHQRCSCLHSPRGRLRYADRLRRPRWRNGQA
jgi:hypothetical protein